MRFDQAFHRASSFDTNHITVSDLPKFIKERSFLKPLKLCENFQIILTLCKIAIAPNKSREMHGKIKNVKTYSSTYAL